MSSDGNVIMAWNWWSDGNMDSFTSEVGNLVAVNLMNAQPSELWRSQVGTPIPDQVFVFDLQDIQVIRSIIFYNHNLSYNAQIKIEITLDDPSFSTILFEETWDAVQPVYGYGEGPYGLIPYGGFDDSAQNYPYFFETFTDSLGNFVVGRYVRITISDPNNIDQYIQGGRLAISDIYQAEYNFAYGHSAAVNLYKTGSEIQIKTGGFRGTDSATGRELSFTFNSIVELDMIELIRSFYQVTNQFNIFVQLFPNETTTFSQFQAMLGFYAMDKLQYTHQNNLFQSTTITIKEAI